MSSHWVHVGTVPGSSGGAGFTDEFSLGFKYDDFSTTPLDELALSANLSLEDTNLLPTEQVTFGMSGSSFQDASPAPTDMQTFTLRNWLSGSAQSSGSVTNPANANGQNNGTVATITTVALGSSTSEMLSACGATLPAVTVVSALYRGWFNANIPLTTSSCAILGQSTTGLFSNFVMLSTNSSLNRLNGAFTFDLMAAGIDTLAKLQSLRVAHRSSDAIAGTTPAVFTVDAGCIEIAAAFA